MKRDLIAPAMLQAIGLARFGTYTYVGLAQEPAHIVHCSERYLLDMCRG